MLTEKDYCDYETCVALKEVGCDQHYDKYKETNSKGKYIFDWFTLYEAAKWLRGEKDLYIEVIHNQINGMDVFNVHISNSEFCIDSVFGKKSYEEALSEGIKEAIKILKDERID